MEGITWDATFWHWWVLGLALLILEILTPGFFFMWMGISAGVVGLVLLLYPELGWQYQLMAFAVLSVLSVLVWRVWLRRHPTPSDQPALNRRGAQYLGRTFTLEMPIVNGRGRIHVDDTYWRAEGQDLPAGAKVRVVAVDGVVLRVQRTDGEG
jgi:membrane protein implicated in regulation of membrane protease activity